MIRRIFIGFAAARRGAVEAKAVANHWPGPSLDLDRVVLGAIAIGGVNSPQDGQIARAAALVTN